MQHIIIARINVSFYDRWLVLINCVVLHSKLFIDNTLYQAIVTNSTSHSGNPPFLNPVFPLLLVSPLLHWALLSIFHTSSCSSFHPPPTESCRDEFLDLRLYSLSRDLFYYRIYFVYSQIYVSKLELNYRFIYSMAY